MLHKNRIDNPKVMKILRKKGRYGSHCELKKNPTMSMYDLAEDVFVCQILLRIVKICRTPRLQFI